MTLALDVRDEVTDAVGAWMAHPSPETYEAVKVAVARMNRQLDDDAPGEFYMDTPEVTCHEETVSLLTWCRDELSGGTVDCP